MFMLLAEARAEICSIIEIPAWFKRGSHAARGLLRLSDTVVPSSEPWSHMNPSACPAAMLPEADRINLAVLALAGTATITDLAAGHNVSRKFVYQQANKASAALAEV